MRLHLGCGDNPRPPGYVHLDRRAEAHPTVVADVERLPCASDCLDEVYFSHGLEHVPRPRVSATLREWARVLKHGGTLRLAMPDFEALATLYVRGRMPVLRILGLLYGRQDHPHNVHYCAYDYETLAVALQQNGFYGIDRWRPDWLFPEGYDDFSYAEIDRQCVSLNVTAKAK